MRVSSSLTLLFNQKLKTMLYLDPLFNESEEGHNYLTSSLLELVIWIPKKNLSRKLVFLMNQDLLLSKYSLSLKIL